MLCLFRCSSFAFNSGAAFLSEDTDAKSFSMGSAFTAICDNPNSIVINPAGLGYSLNSEMSLDYKKNLLDGYNSSAFLTLPLKKIGTLGFGIGLYDLGSVEINYLDGTSETVNAMQSWVFNLGFGMNLSDEIVTGLNLKYITSVLASKYNARAFAVDLGSIYRTVDDFFSFGLAFQNIGTSLTYIQQGDPLPFTIRTGVGINIRYAENFQGIVSSDLLYYNDKIRCNFGTQLDILNILSIRAGYKLGNNPDVLTFGFGVKIDQVKIDYAYSMLGNMDNMQMFTMSYGFGIASNFEIAMMYYEKGISDRALLYFNKIEKTDLNYIKAQEYIKIEGLVKECRRFINDSDFEAAETNCNIIEQMDPENVNAKRLEKKEIADGLNALSFSNQAKKYQKDKEFDKAIEYYLKGIRILPQYEKYCSENKYLIGECYEGMQSYRNVCNAITMYNEVINSYPENMWAEKALKRKKELLIKLYGTEEAANKISNGNSNNNRNSPSRPTAKQQDEAGVVSDYYNVTGTSADNFLRSSAELYVNFRATRILLDRISRDIKKMAMSHVAADAVTENIEEAPTIKSIEILKAKKTELKKEEIEYFVKTIISIVQSCDTLNTSIVKGKDLIPQAVTLVTKVPSELTGFNALKLPGVISGIDKAKNQISDVITDGPVVLKELLTFVEVFKALTE